MLVELRFQPVGVLHLVDQSLQPLFTGGARAQMGWIACDDAGQSGYRVQVLYVHASDVTRQYDEYLPSIRAWAAEAISWLATLAQTGISESLLVRAAVDRLVFDAFVERVLHALSVHERAPAHLD